MKWPVGYWAINSRYSSKFTADRINNFSTRSTIENLIEDFPNVAWNLDNIYPFMHVITKRRDRRGHHFMQSQPAA